MYTLSTESLLAFYPPNIAIPSPTSVTTSYRHWLYQGLEYVQVHGDWHVVGPVQPFPPHCPQRTCVAPVGVAAAVVLVVLVGCCTVVLVVRTDVESVVGVAVGAPVAAARSTLETEVQAAFLLKLES